MNNKQVIDLTEFESKQAAVFFTEWLNNGQNATKAYMTLHPNVDYNSARTLGSRMLTKVDIYDVLTAHKLGLETYMQELKEGLRATMLEGSMKVPDHKTRRLYHKVLGELLGIEGKETRVKIQNNQYNFVNLGADIAKSARERGLPY